MNPHRALLQHALFFVGLVIGELRSVLHGKRRRGIVQRDESNVVTSGSRYPLLERVCQESARLLRARVRTCTCFDGLPTPRRVRERP